MRLYNPLDKAVRQVVQDKNKFTRTLLIAAKSISEELTPEEAMHFRNNFPFLREMTLETYEAERRDESRKKLEDKNG